MGIFIFFFGPLLVFFMDFPCGTATHECPLPGNTSLIYFDLEQLSLIALQQASANTILKPSLCETGKDAECMEQQCCPDEVSCCLTSSSSSSVKNHIRKCGCKTQQDEKCMYPAPYAIMGNTECGIGEKTQITGCLREGRDIDNLAEQPGLKLPLSIKLVFIRQRISFPEKMPTKP